MAMLISRKTPNFLLQRLLRVYPTYFIVLALAYVLRSMTRVPLNFSDFFAILPLFPFDSGLDYKLGIEWTLLYEIFYYLVCAMFCHPKGRKLFPAFLVCWFLSTLGGAYVLPVPPIKPNLLNIWLSIWNIGFIGGALTYYMLHNERTSTVKAWSLIIALATVLVALTLQHQHTHLLLMIGICSCILLGILVKLESYFRSPRLFVTLGDNSYALYLAHVTIILFCFDNWAKLTGKEPAISAGILAFTVCLLASWPLGRMDIAVHQRLKTFFKNVSARKRKASFQDAQEGNEDSVASVANH